MKKENKRKEFLESLKTIKNHMNWCKIKTDPEDKDEIIDSRIEYDYVSWKNENDDVIAEINKFANNYKLSLIDLIMNVHFRVCEYFVFDEFCYFLGKYDKEKNVCTIDQKYGRNPNSKWIEERKKHNRRICFELSRFVAFKIKQLANEECDVFLVSDEHESHYATAVICKDFKIIIDSDDYIKGEDLNRVKLGLKLNGITIVSDENDIVKKALEKINLNRKSKNDFEKEAKEDSAIKGEFEWIDILLNKTKIIDNDGIYKYMKPILEFKGYEPKKIWKKDGEKYIQTLYLPWNMDYMIINSLGLEILSSREFFDNIQEGKFLPNKNRDEVAKEIVYNG